MAQITLLLGGARSGKSSYAIQLAKIFGDPVIYLAPGVPCDEEMKDRIKKHKEARSQSWETIEEPLDIDTVLKRLQNYPGLILLDDLSFWVSNLLHHYQQQGKERNQLKEEVLNRVKNTISIAQEIKPDLIIVSNEVGMGVVPKTNLGRIYRDVLGRVNQLAADHADQVYLMVAGLPVKVK